MIRQQSTNHIGPTHQAYLAAALGKSPHANALMAWLLSVCVPVAVVLAAIAPHSQGELSACQPGGWAALSPHGSLTALIVLIMAGATAAGSHLLRHRWPHSAAVPAYNAVAAATLSGLILTLGGGVLVAHLPFFILTAALLIYRDWRLIMLTWGINLFLDALLLATGSAGLASELSATCLTAQQALVQIGVETAHAFLLAFIAKRLYTEDTQLAELQRNLLARSDQLHALFNYSPDPTWIIQNNTFIECNLAAVEFLGYRNTEELKNLHPSRLSPEFQPDGQTSFAKAEAMMAAAKEKGIHRFEWVHTRADGSEFLAEVTLLAISLLGEPAIYCSWRDITAQRKLQEELNNHRDHLEELVAAQTQSIKAMVDTAAAGLITIDPQGTILSFNAEAERMFGFDASEVLGRDVGMLMPEPDRSQHPHHLRHYRGSQSSRMIGIGRELRGLRRNGSEFPLYLNVTEMTIGGEKRFTGVMMDISARKEAEAALIQAREAAESANRAKTNFLANMSHEIRTPMNAIIGMTALLLETPLSPEQQKLLRTVDSSAQSLLTILNDILDISKLESGKMVLEQTPFNLQALLEDVVDLISVSAAEKGLHVSLSSEGPLPAWVLGDPTRLRQVLLNLAGNAVKFTEHGSICLSVRPTVDPGRWHFSVKDTGIGIPEDRLARIFERFSQADDSTTRRFGGTGLGISICKELIECMGGRLWVHSVVGTGSDFQFTIALPPAAGQRPSIPPREKQDDATTPRPMKILVAEDVEANQLLITTWLNRWQHQITLAENGRIALEKFQQQPFDLILMDVMMPEMDGLQATRAIREIEAARGGHIPIIILTADVMAGHLQHYLDNGADDVAGKPTDFPALKMKIERLTAVT